jgi:hypothetical protein
VTTDKPFKLGTAYDMLVEPGDFAALGRFIASCSVLEGALHSILRHILALDENLARLLLGEPSIVDLSKKLRLTLELTRPEYNAQYDLLHQEITYINEVRSWVAHKMFGRHKEFLVFSNIMSAKSKSAIKGYCCTPTQIDNLSDYTTHVTWSVQQLVKQRHRDLKHYEEIVAKLLASEKKLDLPIPPSRTDPKDFGKPIPAAHLVARRPLVPSLP